MQTGGAMELTPRTILPKESLVKVLLDTNIVIPREDGVETPKNIASLLKLINGSDRAKVLIHPASKMDLSNDGNASRRKVVLSKLDTYSEIEQPPTAPSEFINSLYDSPNSHDRVDGELLYCVKVGVVDFLVTEDRIIIKKAQNLGLEDNVLTVDEGLGFFSNLLHNRPAPKPPFVQQGRVYSLRNRLHEQFFDSFREEYAGFDAWFSKKARDRLCYYVLERGHLIALAILKEENDPILFADGTMLEGKDFLKICSLKVSESSSGSKIIEKLLEIIFNHCMKNKYQETYVTVFPKHSNLIFVLKRFGFEAKGAINTREEVYLKSFVPDVGNTDPVGYLRKYYPRFRDDVCKYIVPIKPKFHRELFPDIVPGQRLVDAQDKEISYYASYGNAIIKIYISTSRIKKIEPGSVFFFYRSGSAAGITTMGIVEISSRFGNMEELVSFCGNRTVYSIKQLNDMLLSARSILAVKFWHINTEIPKSISKYTLRKLKIPIPQSISKLQEMDYGKLRGVIHEGSNVDQAKVR